MKALLRHLVFSVSPLPAALVATLLLAFSASSQAHNEAFSQLSLHQALDGKVTGHLEVPLTLLDRLLDFDLNNDQKLSWQELLQQEARITSWIETSVSFRLSEQLCQPIWRPLQLRQVDVGVNLYLALQLECTQPLSATHTLTIEYDLLFDQDPTQRVWVRYQNASAQDTETHLLLADARSIELGAETRKFWPQQWRFLTEGVIHILIGWDHLLFLFALLLPAIFRLHNGVRSVHTRFRPLLYDVCRIVTAFTLAHSLTLALAALGQVELAASWIEFSIAASVVFSALLFWVPRAHAYRWHLAFAFGLVHGFGFANLLRDIQLPQEGFVAALLSFNLGVEFGQLFIVSLVLPFMFWLRNSRAYTAVGIPVGMLAIASMGVFWMLERSSV